MQNTNAFDREWSRNGLSVPGWIALGLFFAVLIGAVSGWIVPWFGFGFEPLLAVQTMASAFLIHKILQTARIRFRFLALAAAILLPLTAFASSEYTEYQVLRQEIIAAVYQKSAEEAIRVEEIDLAATVDSVIVSAAGAPGFQGFIALRLQKNLPETIVRMLVAALLGILIWKDTYKTPQCHACGFWYGKDEKVGALAVEDFEEFQDMVDSGNFFSAGRMLTEEIKGYPKINLYQKKCKNCQGADVFLIAEKFSIGSKGLLITHVLRMPLTNVQHSNLISGTQAAEKRQTADMLPAA